MEKINKEELMKKLGLTEEEMEKVFGGGYDFSDNDTFNWCCFGQRLAAAGLIDKEKLNVCPPPQPC